MTMQKPTPVVGKDGVLRIVATPEPEQEPVREERPDVPTKPAPAKRPRTSKS